MNCKHNSDSSKIKKITFQPGERVLSETSLRFLQLENMNFSNSSPFVMGKDIFASLLKFIKQSFEQQAFCSVCKVIRSNSSIYSREDIAVNFLYSNSVRKGSKDYFNRDLIKSKIKFLNIDEPLKLIIPSYSIKTLRLLKTYNQSPDCAEIFGLLKLMFIAKGLEHILNRKCKFIIISDGHRFQKALNHTDEEVFQYQSDLQNIINFLQIKDWVEVNDYERIIGDSLGLHQKNERWSRYYQVIHEYEKRMLPIFNVNEIDRSISKMISVDPDFDSINSNGEGRFVALFRSIMYSINILDKNVPYDLLQILEKNIYCNIFQTNDKEYGGMRSEILDKTLRSAIEYIARIKMDRMGEDPLMNIYPSSIRCTIHPKPNQLGLITLNLRTRIEPWHGSAYIIPHENSLDLGVDFRIALENSDLQRVKHEIPWNNKFAYLYFQDYEYFMNVTLNKILDFDGRQDKIVNL